MLTQSVLIAATHLPSLFFLTLAACRCQPGANQPLFRLALGSLMALLL